jgi:membrane protease YdiL (CAAX protease family)
MSPEGEDRRGRFRERGCAPPVTAPADAERRAARRAALRWAAGVLVLGNAGHAVWGERDRPSEAYTLVKIAGLLPLTVWALRSRELTPRGELDLAETIRLWPARPAHETLAGLASGAALATPLALARVLPRAPAVPIRLAAAALAPEALLFRLTVSLPLTTVFLEELIFRGLLQRRFERAWPPSVALLVTSLLFGLWHLAAGAQAVAGPGFAGARRSAKVLAVLAPPLGTVPAGLVFGWLARRYGTLWAPLVAHWVVAAALLAACRETTPAESSIAEMWRHATCGESGT